MDQPEVVGTVAAVVGLLLVAAAAAIGLRRTPVPYSVGLVLIGIALGALVDRIEGLEALGRLELSPGIILFVFLPTLIFESAYTLDSRLLAKNLGPVLALAAPGLLLSTGIVGGLLAWLTPLPLGVALVFGALISATDPVAVIALFREVGAPRRLAILVEGESLFNDATAIVLFRILLVVVTGGAVTAATVGDGVLEFAVVFLGGLLIGALIGWLLVRSIALAPDAPLVEVVLSTVVAYLAFIAADHYLGVSGVMATVGAGVVVGTLGATRFSPEVRDYLHRFWEWAAFVANSLIFLLVGLTVRPGVLLDNAVLIGWAVLATLLARAATVYGLLPVLERLPRVEPTTLPYRTVLFWGGLRGAVALALALSLPAGFPQREVVVALAVGVVLFTLLGGGLTIGPVIRTLGLDRPTLVERVTRVQAVLAARRTALERLTRLRTAEHFSSGELTSLQMEYRRRVTETERELAALRAECGRQDMRHVLWAQALTIEQTVYHDLGDRGAVSEPVLRELALSVDLRRDRLGQGELPRTLDRASPLEIRVAERLIGLVERFAPGSRPVQRHRLRALAARYEHDMAVLEATERVTVEIAHLGELSGVTPELVAECREVYQALHREAMTHLDQVAEHFPEYARAVQRQTLARMALDGEHDAIQHLRQTGGLPANVAQDALGRVGRAQRRLARQPVEALTPDPAELLGRVPFLVGLDPADVARIVDALVPRTVLAGETVIAEGGRGTSLFLVARGVVAVIRDGPAGGRRLASLHPGDFFGESALLTGTPRNATVRAVTDGQLFELSREAVDRVAALCPAVRLALQAAHRKRQAAAPDPA